MYYGRVGEETGLVLKMEGEGAMAPGMQTASRSRKGKEMDSPLEPPDKNTPSSTLLSAQGDPCGLQQPTELEDDGTCVPSPRVYGNLWQQQKATHTHTSGKDTEPVLRQGPSSLSHGPRLCHCPFPSLPLSPPSSVRPSSFSRRAHPRAIKRAYASLPSQVSTLGLDFTRKRDSTSAASHRLP